MSSKKISKPRAKRSSKPATATAKKKTAAKKNRVAHDYAKLFSAAVKANDGEPTSFTTSEAPNAARHGVGAHDRTSDGTISPKHKLCVKLCTLLKAGKAIPTVKQLSSEFKALKAGTIASFIGNWKRGIVGGAFYPSTAVDQFGGYAGVDKLFAKLRKNNS